MLSSPLAAAPPPSSPAFMCAAPGGRWAEVQLAWTVSGTGNRRGRRGRRGERGLVVYQVSNTEANELPGLSGLASRQRAVARIHYD